MTNENLQKAKELENRIKSLQSFLHATECKKHNNPDNTFLRHRPGESFWRGFLRSIKYSFCPKSKRVGNIDTLTNDIYTFESLDDEFLQDIQDLCLRQIEKLQKRLEVL